jgi:hypothetical protein
MYCLLACFSLLTISVVFFYKWEINMSEKDNEENGTESGWNYCESQIRYGCPAVAVPEQDDLEKFGAGKDILDNALNPSNGIVLSSGLGFRIDTMKKVAYSLITANEKEILRGSRFLADSPDYIDEEASDVVDMFSELQKMTLR